MRKLLFLVFALVIAGCGSVLIRPPWSPEPVLAVNNLQVNSSASDGDIAEVSNSSWDAVRDDATGTVDAADSDIKVQSNFIAGLPDTWAIMRGFLLFDTADLPDDCYIDTVTVYLFVTDWATDDDAILVIGSGMPTYPHDPLVSADFDRTLYSATHLGEEDIDLLPGSDDYYGIVLNASGEAAINKTGYTKFILRTDYDVDDYEPTGLNWVTFHSGDVASEKSYVSVNYISLPTVTTYAASDVATTTATANGDITGLGGDTACSYRGCVYDTSDKGDLGNVNPVGSAWTYNSSEGPGSYSTGAYTCSLTSLTPNVTYYYRTWAKNTAGWDYSNDVRSFHTLKVPTLTTSVATSVTNNSARLPGDVTDAGYPNPTVMVFWGDNDGGTTPGSWDFSSVPTSPAQPQAAGAFYKDVASLLYGHTYYFTARAVNDAATVWTATRSFVTTSDIPILTTSAASSVTNTTARLNGNVTNDGDENPTVVVYWGDNDGGTGVWDFNGAPTSPAQPQGVAAFYKDVSSLSPGVMYYFSAAGTNDDGTFWAATTSFMTTDVYPSITTNAASAVINVSATLNGNITNTGGDPTCDYRGFCWDTITHGNPGDLSPAVCGYDGPPGLGYYTYSGTYGTGAYTYALAGLTQKTTYYVRAYTHNSSGWVYGDEVNFTTEGVPDVTTVDESGTTDTATYLNGNITSMAGDTPTVRGFDYGLTVAYGSEWTESGTYGTGAYQSAEISGLTPGTTYHFRAKAYNAYGWGYGADTTATTLPEDPTNLNYYELTYTSISFSWTPGAHAQQSMLRYSLTGYPATPASGTEAYFNTGTTVTINSLTPGQEYYFRLWSWVSGSDVWSDGYSQSYIVMPVPNPQALKAKAIDANTINLWWLVADNMTSVPNVYTVIMGQVGGYPTDPPDPTDTEIYNEITGDEGVKNYIWEGAAPGTPYFFGVWFYNVLTDNYTDAVWATVTTPAGFSDETYPGGSGYFEDPDAAGQADNPFDPVVASSAAQWGFEHGMMWAFIVMLITILIGMALAIYSKSGLITTFGMLAIMVSAGIAGICPYWVCVPFTILGIALTYVAAKSYG